jgi:putative intracellular protease/amidase
MRVLFIISGSDTAFWLSEVTHPYWHLAERGVDVDFASPAGGKVVWDQYSDPYFKNSTEPDDLVSKGFLSDTALRQKLEKTLALKDVELDRYDAVHVAGGRGATFDLYPNEDVAKALEHFWAGDKVVGAICHGAIALGNIPNRVRGRRVTGYTLEGDHALERLFGSGFLIPHYPQTVLEQAGTVYSRVAPNDPLVVIDGKLVTGQNQQSASEYALVLLHAMTGSSPVTRA